MIFAVVITHGQTPLNFYTSRYSGATGERLKMRPGWSQRFKMKIIFWKSSFYATIRVVYSENFDGKKFSFL